MLRQTPACQRVRDSPPRWGEWGANGDYPQGECQMLLNVVSLALLAVAAYAFTKLCVAIYK